MKVKELSDEQKWKIRNLEDQQFDWEQEFYQIE